MTTRQEYKFRADVLRRNIGWVTRRECHHIGYGDITVRPDYCERITMTEDQLEECTCCPQCCGCGG